MGLGERLRRWFDPPQEPDPDEWVIVAVVPFHEGPMAQSALEAAGIAVVLVEARLFVTHHTGTLYRIVVRARDVAEATELLADLRAPAPPDPFLDPGP